MTLVFSILFALVLPAQAVVDVDPRGPVEYPGMHVTVDAQGIQASHYKFQNNRAKPSPWSAHWIWLDGDATATAGMFRKEITLAEVPRTVEAWLTADLKYRLYVNGRLVSCGPVDIGRDHQGGNTLRWFYDCRELTPFFTNGTNVITAEVFRQSPIWATVSRGQPGFLFEGEITGGNGEKTTVMSDATWHSHAALQFPDGTTLDAGKEPTGWRLAGFDDSESPASREVKDVWEMLSPSEIPRLMEARYPVTSIAGLPKNKTFTNDGSFKVVFDRVLSAYPTLQVRGGKGAELTIKANNHTKVILNDGELFYEFPFMTEIAPSFTVDLKHATEPVDIVDVGANFTSQPMARSPAHPAQPTPTQIILLFA